eukprot:GHVL01035463.1.p2 GENE.GHVL01035463.1~~GHVL01035463.1.p2  ORF type:complete len:141 (-),score=9.22 GHVL01035463.1:377-799(-)
MFVAGVVAFFLDNTIPGTREERGLSKWRQAEQPSGEEGGKLRVYDLPWIQPRLNRLRVTKRLPFCPGFIGFSSRRRASKNERTTSEEEVNEGFEANSYREVLSAGKLNEGFKANSYHNSGPSDGGITGKETPEGNVSTQL